MTINLLAFSVSLIVFIPLVITSTIGVAFCIWWSIYLFKKFGIENRSNQKKSDDVELEQTRLRRPLKKLLWIIPILVAMLFISLVVLVAFFG